MIKGLESMDVAFTNDDKNSLSRADAYEA